MKKSKLLGAALAATIVSSAFAVTSISASAEVSGSGIEGDSVGIVGSFNNWGNSGESDIPMTYNISYDYAENEDGTITLYGFESEEAANICAKGGDYDNPPVYVIPDKIDGKTVTRIAYHVDGKDAITTEEVNLGSNLWPNLQSEVYKKSINRALQGYKIKLPDTIKELGDFAFMNMEFVDDKLPEGLERIGISSCTHVRNKKLVMPSTLKYIGSQAFAECDLKEIIFNEGLEYIGSYAFCVLPPFASEITIPKSVKYLGWDFIYSNAWSADTHGKSWYQTDIQYNIYGGGFVEQYMKTYVPFHREGIPAGYNYKVIGQIDAVPAQTEKVNGLKVSGAIPEGAEFKAVSTTTKWLKDPLFCYEITLNKDGKEVQPDGYITISIPCEYGNGYVVCINEETGEMENLNSIYCDGYYVFVTDHLSQYGIKFDSDPVKAQTSETQQSETQQSDPQQSETQQSNPQQSQTVTPVQPNNTPKTADTTPFFAAVFAVAVSAATVIALRKRKA